MEQIINFDTVSAVKSIAKDYAQLDNAYLVAHFDRDCAAGSPGIDRVLRVEGFSLMLVKSGRLSLEINLDRFEVQGPAICVMPPSCRVVFSPEASRDTEIYILFLAQNYLQNININFSAFNLPSTASMPSPVQEISAEECAVVERYIDLLRINTRGETSVQLATNLGSSLVSALVYEMAKMQYRRINRRDAEPGYQRSPRVAYVHDFIKLVRAHYTSERSVAFYASKLFISPKYLSLVVKEATGRSAARWIDEFVLMEAKNLLRYSGKNIQQVAYALNFSNQSAFGKYFKHLTGMSPTEYQKS